MPALARRFLCALVAVPALCASTALAQPDQIYHVDRATSPIELDGHVDEAAWDDATHIELNFEVQPGENIAPPVKTVCLITYDDSKVYFAFRADDPDPSLIRARYSDRDRAWNDDWVGIVLDTFNDQRRAYELFSTPLGVQIDAINDDVTGNYDDSWNAIWESAGQITDTGFEVEMAVPFNQIRFQQADGEQIWGFDAIRSYPRQFRHHIGAFPRDRGANSYLGQAIKIEGMAGADPGKNLELIPTLTGSKTDTRENPQDSGYQSGDPETEVGLSMRWGLTPNASLNAALNPDFSQIEADAIQLDVNEQFALLFRETRPFFLEGADYFNTDLFLVHTRTVVDPEAAGKLTGKSGGHTWGVFSARDNTTNILVPGEEGSSGGNFDLDNWSTSARYRYDFGSSSTIGATLTDRRGGGYANSVYSADMIYRITSKDKLNTSIAFSRTEYDQAMVDELGVSADTLYDEGFILDYEHTERAWWVNGRVDHFGEDYRTDLGFRPQVGFNSGWLGGAKIWWGEEGDFFQRTAWGASANHAERVSGGLLEQDFRSWLNTQGPRQSQGSVDLGLQTINFSDRDFELVNGSVSAFAQATGNFALAFDVTLGDWVDFAHARPATRYLVRPSAEYTLGRHLNIHGRYTFSRLDVDMGHLFSAHAPELRIIHQFNARAFIRLVLQYRWIDRTTDNYALAIDSRSESLLTQFLFTYKLNPQTAIYAGYSDNQLADDDSDLTRMDRTFFTKFSYAWVR